jgi:hypothetical protein
MFARGSSAITSTSKPGNFASGIKSGKKVGFLPFCQSLLVNVFSQMWLKLKKGMWIFTTGSIVLVLPFILAYVNELNKNALILESQNLQKP